MALLERSERRCACGECGFVNHRPARFWAINAGAECHMSAGDPLTKCFAHLRLPPGQRPGQLNARIEEPMVYGAELHAYPDPTDVAVCGPESCHATYHGNLGKLLRHNVFVKLAHLVPELPTDAVHAGDAGHQVTRKGLEVGAGHVPVIPRDHGAGNPDF